MIFGPAILSIALLVTSLFCGWKQPLRVDRLELRAGYGVAVTDKNQPTNFQITPLLPSIGVGLTGPVGPSWLRGRIEWNPELYLAILSHPYVRPMLGAHPLQFRYTLEPIGRWAPYLLSHLGVLHANLERRETSSDFNFSVGVGVGVRCALTEKAALLLEYRRHHISNAGLDEKNTGLDSNNFLIGVSVRA